MQMQVQAYSYLTRGDIEALNAAVTGAPANVINGGNLDNAVLCQNQVLFGVEINPTLADKASCMGFRLAQGHPFGDGNKRTASLAVEILVKKNRDGKGLLGSPQYIIGATTEVEPMSREDFHTALAKLIPNPTGDQEP